MALGHRAPAATGSRLFGAKPVFSRYTSDPSSCLPTFVVEAAGAHAGSGGGRQTRSTGQNPANLARFQYGVLLAKFHARFLPLTPHSSTSRILVPGAVSIHAGSTDSIVRLHSDSFLDASS